ncbi:MAG: hypothetical protein AAGU05_00195, partial [Anaerolineaceae bacterium]
MNTNTVRTLFVLFLLAHGWVHFSLTQVPLPQPGALRTPFFPSWWRNAVDPQWPASKLGLAPETTRTMGWILWVMVVALYVLSAVLLFTMPSHPG